jgi:hypothetical protein
MNTVIVLSPRPPRSASLHVEVLLEPSVEAHTNQNQQVSENRNVRPRPGLVSDEQPARDSDGTKSLRRALRSRCRSLFHIRKQLSPATPRSQYTNQPCTRMIPL